jgi:hypothetical protein
MGQKVNVLGYRLGQKNQGPQLGWKSIWCKKGLERGTTLQIQSLSQSFFQEILNQAGLIPVDFKTQIVQKNNMEYWDWTIQILGQPFLQQWRREKNPFQSKDWYTQYQLWLLQHPSNSATSSFFFSTSNVEKSKKEIQGKKWSEGSFKEEWEIRMEQDWKRTWEKNKESGHCPNINRMIQKVLQAVGRKNVKIRVNIEVVDALSSAEAYLKATLHQNFLRAKKKSWRILFQEIMKERREENRPYAYRVWSSGRHNGVEIARTEKIQEGRLSFQRLDDVVEYSYEQHLTKYGQISFKLWMFPKKIKPIYTYTSPYFSS